MPDEELLTTADVARLIGMSTRTVHRAIEAGELKFTMQAGPGVNAPYLFSHQEVARFIAARVRHERKSA
jgi:excisionase family DNA binding protein